jgi:hypothetical protein
LQTKDGLTDDITTDYSPDIEDAPRPYASTKRSLAVVAACLVPGAGHLVLGKYGRGLLFLATILGSFFIGLSLHARLFWPLQPSAENASSPDFINILWFFSQIGTGLCYLICYLLGIGMTPQPAAAAYEYGNAFTFLAGLLNYLVIYDAYDIATGRKK